MAIKSTVFKATLSIANLDRNYYQDHSLTIARHPSETDERMMIRLLAYAYHASEYLVFTKGLSTDSEPELWQKSLSDEMQLWIDLGQPNEKRIRKACRRSLSVWVISYGGHAADIWWEQNRNKLTRFENLSVINLPTEATEELAGMVTRTMQLQCMIQDGIISISNGKQHITIEPQQWLLSYSTPERSV